MARDELHLMIDAREFKQRPDDPRVIEQHEPAARGAEAVSRAQDHMHAAGVDERDGAQIEDDQERGFRNGGDRGLEIPGRGEAQFTGDGKMLDARRAAHRHPADHGGRGCLLRGSHVWNNGPNLVAIALSPPATQPRGKQTWRRWRQVTAAVSSAPRPTCPPRRSDARRAGVRALRRRAFQRCPAALRARRRRGGARSAPGSP